MGKYKEKDVAYVIIWWVKREQRGQKEYLFSSITMADFGLSYIEHRIPSTTTLCGRHYYPLLQMRNWEAQRLSNHLHIQGYMANTGQSHDLNPNLCDPANQNAFSTTSLRKKDAYSDHHIIQGIKWQPLQGKVGVPKNNCLQEMIWSEEKAMGPLMFITTFFNMLNYI